MQELFSKLEIEHPAFFNTNTLEGRQFVNNYYKFFELEKEQIETAFFYGGNMNLGELDYYKETFKIETV